MRFMVVLPLDFFGFIERRMPDLSPKEKRRRQAAGGAVAR
jgi:hypothetical protein